jgi:hypothetical protein
MTHLYFSKVVAILHFLIEFMGSPIYFSPAEHRPFWEHLHSECPFPIATKQDIKNREEILAKLERDVEKRKYRPAALLGTFRNYKGKFVSRPVPVLTLPDYAIMFGCLRAMDRRLESIALENTFGTWALDGSPVSKDSKFDLHHPRMDFSESDSADGTYAYTKWTWVKKWREYYKKLDENSASGEFQFVLSLDIANFFNSVNHTKLFGSLRSYSGVDPFVIDVMEEVVRSCEIETVGYSSVSYGLPQELLGDISRPLASHYLLPFDHALQEYCLRLGIKFFRWVDDIIVFCHSSAEADVLQTFIGEQLRLLSLSLNQSKVQSLTIEAFRSAYGFEIMSAFGERKIPEAMSMLQTSYSDASFARRFSALKRALYIVGQAEGFSDEKMWIREQIVLNRDVLLSLQAYQFTDLLGLYDRNEGDAAIASVLMPVIQSPFTYTKAAMLNAVAKERRLFTHDFRQEVAKRTLKSDDSLVNLVVEHLFPNLNGTSDQ